MDKVSDPHLADLKPSNTFRQSYRKLSVEEMRSLDAIKDKATELEDLIMHITPGRHRSLAMTRLEECVMWAVKGLTT